MMDDFILGSGPKETPRNVGETQPEATPPLKKTDLTILIISIIALLLIFAYTTTKPKETKIKITEIQPNVYEINVTGLQVAEKTNEFLNTLEVDGYYQNKICSATGNCTKTNFKSVPFFGWDMMANAALYSATKKSEYEINIRKDMDSIEEHSSGFDMFWVLPQIHEAYRATGDQKYLRYVYYTSSYLLFQETEQNTEPLSKTTMTAAMEAQAFGLLHNMLSDDDTTKKIVKILDEDDNQPNIIQERFQSLNQSVRLIRHAEALSENDPVIYNSADFKIRNFDCWIGLAKTELADEPQMLSEAENFFGKFSLIIKEGGSNQLRFSSLVETQPCIGALFILYDKTKKTEYKETAEKMLNDMLNQWDFKSEINFRGKCEGDDGFHSSQRGAGEECTHSTKSVADNSYAVYLFTMTPDKIYSVEKHGK